MVTHPGLLFSCTSHWFPGLDTGQWVGSPILWKQARQLPPVHSIFTGRRGHPFLILCSVECYGCVSHDSHARLKIKFCSNRKRSSMPVVPFFSICNQKLLFPCDIYGIMMGSSSPLLNRILSDFNTHHHPNQPPSSEDGNHYGTLQNVDLNALLDILLKNRTLTSTEQQVVVQETNKEKQCQALMQIVCGKGWNALENFFKSVSSIQQHQTEIQQIPSGESRTFIGASFTDTATTSTSSGSMEAGKSDWRKAVVQALV